ncbi:hypothetical protein [Microbispora catharanthi]|uniref:Uncharacterized protein n=1 Tax=Microbispora catharanthi TaxID=1712871 RepID=A0A5N6C5E6_9ACTN|nr:hypothetical protein [Microbispora catharanthi]KAB8187610.1 hypothetical protein FH610_000030 [Microbispora catharanthi]
MTSDDGVDWFTNSRTWSIILERAMRVVDQAKRTEYARHADKIGIDFTLIDAENRPEIAQWLLETIEALSGPEAAEHGWDTEADKSHLQDLAAMLRRMAQK